MLTNAEITAMA